jgi:protein-arginine kinase activator protein McsA
MSTLQVTQNEKVCARCGFTTTDGREAQDEGILCSKCYSQYDEETAENLAVDNWFYE